MSGVVQPRAALRLAAAATALLAVLGVALVLLVATLMGGLTPQGCATTANFAPSAVALADIPGDYLGWIRAAAPRYGLDWTVIAGIYSIESDFGRLDAAGVRSGENFAGAGGPGQFLAATWERYGVDGDADGVKDRYDPADAIPGTANLLRQNGAPGVGHGRRPSRGARGRAHLRRRPLGSAAVRPSSNRGARDGSPHARRRHGGRSRARGRRDPGRLGSHGWPPRG